MDLNLLNYCVKKETIELSNNVIPKIPRPPNAFMLYATDNRKVLSHKYPADSNKIISKKLGSNWKNLSEEEKNKYFDRARIIAIEHKEKYPDYVYNPKEARLRKAMREANRDRSIGASPMLPRPSARRAGSSGWVTQGGANVPGGSVASTTHGPHEEPLMMANPLSQLQQQTEMWHNYSDDLRPRSSGNPFMMPDMQAPYHHQPSPPLSIPSPMLIEKHRRTPVHPIHINPISMPMTPPHNSIMSMTPPHSNENVPPDESMHLKDKVLHDNFGQLESKHTIEPSQPLMENNVQQQNEFSSNIYEPNVGFNNSQNHLQHMEKAEEMKMKKIYGCFCHKDVSCKYNLHLPLSCDNFCATPDLYTNDLNYQTNYITNYFNGLPEFEVCNISYEGHCFPCASRINFSEENNSMEDCLPPSFLKTNVGFIPITFGMN
ncbi:transcription factor SOX-7-like isoform X5 [Diorhabda carinulata]|uniref:transcription factor SOX-7-like isoform X5 n=1 Tax=Diorhabda carinulata TaxID=1163345 RepID=UPI0025A274AA|nr:transcription factor SOX-7-like isoform X5 [Diorhabda carinulata]